MTPVSTVGWKKLPSPAQPPTYPDSPPRYEFVHALHREVFYQRQAPSRRTKLHRRVGESMERRFPEEVRRELSRRGHPVNTVGDLDGPCSVEIIRRQEDGMLLAGSDPRRDGWALAW